MRVQQNVSRRRVKRRRRRSTAEPLIRHNFYSFWFDYAHIICYSLLCSPSVIIVSKKCDVFTLRMKKNVLALVRSDQTAWEYVKFVDFGSLRYGNRPLVSSSGVQFLLISLLVIFVIFNQFHYMHLMRAERESCCFNNNLKTS